ncbi:hypothetical protein [Methylosinus sp. LW3]|uniref:hypothetical protein n=1 Tax=Methylosinus sp. LW3 TaxID=107635 RepID=UPI0012ED9C7A|nr:hypothetical protein [Methylosinus sp. LW3]
MAQSSDESRARIGSERAAHLRHTARFEHGKINERIGDFVDVIRQRVEPDMEDDFDDLALAESGC